MKVGRKEERSDRREGRVRERDEGQMNGNKGGGTVDRRKELRKGGKEEGMEGET